MTPQVSDSTKNFQIARKNGDSNITCDLTNNDVLIGTYKIPALTEVAKFSLSSTSECPAVSNTWYMLSATGQKSDALISMGTGSTPATTYDVSASNVAMNLANAFHYVDYDLYIDSVNVWVGADAASALTVKTSLMSYNISSTTGDFSDGTEHAVGSQNNVGHSAVMLSTLTVSTPIVPYRTALVGLVRANGTTTDYSVNMQVRYRIRKRD